MTKLMEGLEHLSSEERKSSGSSSWRREGSEKMLSVYINSLWEVAKRMETGSFWWCPVVRQEAMGTN